jgi:hypothetical protein
MVLLTCLQGCSNPVELSSDQREAARSWLNLADLGQYSDTWHGASGVFRSAIVESDWVKQVRQARSPLGSVISRNQVSAVAETNPLGAPDGAYIVVTYETAFEGKAEATEILSLIHEPDGSWRIAGYFIK